MLIINNCVNRYTLTFILTTTNRVVGTIDHEIVHQGTISVKHSEEVAVKFSALYHHV